MSLNSLKQILGGRNLFLIGMMGAGKSQTGPYLAKKLEYGFVDSDEIIVKAAKQSINEIFEKDGEKKFRDLETQVLKEIGKRYSLIVATGGGVVLRSENWGILHQGIVIWLDPGRDRLLKRLQSDLSKRPLINRNDYIEKFDFLNIERQPLYKECDLRISISNESPDEVANCIINKLPSILIDQSEQQTIGD